MRTRVEPILAGTDNCEVLSSIDEDTLLLFVDVLLPDRGLPPVAVVRVGTDRPVRLSSCEPIPHAAPIHMLT